MIMFESIRAICDEWGTRPHIRDILIDSLREWHERPDEEAFQLQSTTYVPEFQQLIKQQNQIGWKIAFLGRFSWEWSDLQDA